MLAAPYRRHALSASVRAALMTAVAFASAAHAADTDDQQKLRDNSTTLSGVQV